MTAESKHLRFAGRIDNLSPLRFASTPDPESCLSCKVLFRGFIANRAELVRDLDLPGQASDAQLFASAYRHWGLELQQHVVGEYCLAIVDETSHSLFVTRDSIGLRPIYYRMRGRGISFASHIGDLASRSGEPDLDEQFIADYLVYGQHHDSRTVYRDVFSLPFGHSLTWSAAGLRVVRTWHLSAVTPIRYANDSDYEERFLELLQQGVTSAIQGKTWAELSGGLDSSSVVCLAAKRGSAAVETISIVYPRSQTADERDWVDEVISELGIPSHFIDGDETQAFSELPDRFVEEPTRVLNNWRVLRSYEGLMQRAGANTLLSGLGGDQALFGEAQVPIYLADRLNLLRVPGIWRELSDWQRARPARRSRRFLFSESVLQPLHRYRKGRSLIGEIPGGVPWLDPGFKDRMQIDSQQMPAPKPKMPTVWGQFYFERVSQISLVSGQLWNQLAGNYEVRFPLLYRPLVEFMYAVPSDQQIRPGENRSLQRRSLVDVLPEKTRLRKDKKGPDESLFAGLRSNQQMRALLTDRPRVVDRGFVDGRAWKDAVNLASLGHVRAIRSFLSTTSLEIWLQQFG